MDELQGTFKKNDTDERSSLKIYRSDYNKRKNFAKEVGATL